LVDSNGLPVPLNEDAFVVKDANGLTSANLVKTSGYATGFKVPWFGDYSLRCERCGRKVWPWTKHQF
jgi:hypothetical protein